MRLPRDATLIVVDVQQAIDHPRFLPRNNLGAESAIAALIAVWREEALPIVHIRHDSIEADSPYAPGSPGHAFKPQAQPLGGEIVIGKRAHSAFVGTALEAALDRFGATTVVLCGVLTHNSLEATARHAGDLGYRTFVVADACWAVEVRIGHRIFAADDVHALSLAHLEGEYAAVVNCVETVAAARLARARERAKQRG